MNTVLSQGVEWTYGGSLGSSENGWTSEVEQDAEVYKSGDLPECSGGPPREEPALLEDGNI